MRSHAATMNIDHHNWCVNVYSAAPPPPTLSVGFCLCLVCGTFPLRQLHSVGCVLYKYTTTYFFNMVERNRPIITCAYNVTNHARTLRASYI